MYDGTTYCLDGENWMSVIGYEGIYEVSDFGRVRSVEGKNTTSTKHGLRTWNGRIIKPKGINPKTGYRVTLFKEKKKRDFLVCRLVGYAFLSLPDRNMTINHKDGNRFNNHVSNLEWLTLADNIRHAFNTGLMNTKKVRLINDSEEIEFISLARAGAYLGRSHGYISECIKKKKDASDTRGIVFKIVPF